MPIYALVDGNSFYASCQIAFQPHLKNRPVVVLSNNDGCIVAANDIAKALDTPKNYGIGGYHAAKPTSMMFQPYFKVAAMLKRHNAEIFSSNYELYQDMSRRMHSISAQFSDRQEIYSIDESFLDFSAFSAEQRLEQAEQLKQRVMQWIGIPVAVGIGYSKTQAKLANHLAKKLPQQQGIMDLTGYDRASLQQLYKTIDVGKVWGIGKHLSQRLQESGIHTIYDLQTTDSKSLRKRFSVNLERTVRELNGQACLGLQQYPNSKQQIISSRSFGQLVETLQPMREAVSSYAAIAAEKLRRQNSVCHSVTVYITTPRYQHRQQYCNTYCIPLVYPSDNSVLISKIALKALQKIWQPGVHYQKAAVILGKVQNKQAVQFDLFANTPRYSVNDKADKLMQLMDQLNQKMGKGTLQLANCGNPQKQNWRMKRDLMSPRYTTRWQELLIVKAN